MSKDEDSTGSPPVKGGPSFQRLEPLICDIALMSGILLQVATDPGHQAVDKVALLSRHLCTMSKRLHADFYAAHAAGGRA